MKTSIATTALILAGTLALAACGAKQEAPAAAAAPDAAPAAAPAAADAAAPAATPAATATPDAAKADPKPASQNGGDKL